MDFVREPGIEVYKMVITGSNMIQGVIALEHRQDHVYIHLIESAPHNRFDKNFDFVGEHLVAFACQRSMAAGHDGYVAFHSKTKVSLISYYVNVIGAQHIGSGHMTISESVAEQLIMLYLS